MDAYFRSRLRQDPSRDSVWEVIAEHLQRWIDPSSTVLDLGAGYCSFVNHVRAADKHALDVYPGFAQFAAAGVRTQVGACDDLSAFGSGSMDVVFASNLLEHLDRPRMDSTLMEIRRVLREGGTLILVQPNFRLMFKTYFDDFTHITVLTDRSLPDLLVGHGFQVIRVEPRFLPATFHTHWPTWRWLVKLYLSLPYRPAAGQMLVIAAKRAGSFEAV